MIQGGKEPQSAHDSRYPGSVKVEYLFHPLFGQQLPIVWYNTSGKKPQVVLQTDEGLRFVPEWHEVKEDEAWFVRGFVGVHASACS